MLTLEKTTTDLLSLIEVTKPYFALKNLVHDTGYITAKVTQELLDPNELDGMSFAEAGRHIAILGSLSVADLNPVKSKHYYLASGADIERLHDEPIMDKDYSISMRAIQFDKKEASAEGILCDSSGRTLYRGTIRYMVIKAPIFERKFKDMQQDTPKDGLTNPYTKNVELKNIDIDKDKATASVGKVKKEMCLGHFDNYPALPVAQICQSLITLAGQHQKKLFQKNGKYCVRKIKLNANRFVFTNETLSIKSAYEAKTNNFITFANTGGDDDEVRLKCWFY